ncbi:minichromosome maintenance protein MCM [Candidatus Micrarchaeota archaeon]|nr:minichromosome maintenance protein MCM [Candidatus Micrarchaeota archaeon]
MSTADAAPSIKVDLSASVATFGEFFSGAYKKKLDLLRQVYPTERSIYISYPDLEKFDPDLADALIKSPDLVLEAAEQSIRDMNLRVAAGGEFSPRVRFIDVPSDDKLIEQLSSKEINELVSYKCVVTKRAEVMHRIKIAAFKCQLCEFEMTIAVGKDFEPPKKCDNCKKMALKQMDDQSTFVDVQKGEVQELLERVRGGAPTAKIELMMEEELVNKIAPGDTMIIVGILRLRPPLKSRQKQELMYSRYVEVNSITSMKRDFEQIEITKEDEKKILELSKKPDLEEIIISSLAPSIYGHTEVKRAITLQLFGGTRGKTMVGGMPIRDDIHILLIGDPGIAKSRFLMSITEIAPKSIYVSGKSVSGAGLTVSAEKDELGEGGWVLKAGALVLASGGMATIDEFDKIEEEDRATLHEAMESQSISVAKAGIVAKFRTKTAILSAANPKYGRFDTSKNLAEQFDIPPTLLSRFDLIFPIVDVLDEEKDSKLADHILATHMGRGIKDTEIFDRELLRKYISYARRKTYPKLTQMASDKIKQFYVDLRGKGRSSGSVAITPRYLEGLVRLAEAHAKIRLSETVDEADAEVAIGLLNYVMKQIMTDKETGLFDVDTIATGKPKSEREKLQKADTILDIIREILRKNESAEVEQIIADAKGYEIEENAAKKIINDLLRRGIIYEKEYGHVKIVGE